MKQFDHIPGTARKHPKLNRTLKLRYLIGDATQPVNLPTIISHICNDVGAWGRGFVVPLAQRYPKAKAEYKKLCDFKKEDFPYRLELGQTQIFEVDEGIYVANMIAQYGIRWEGKVPPIRYEALKTALTTVYTFALQNSLTVSMPRIGAGLAGGDWNVIEGVILDVMTVDTDVYTLEHEKDNWESDYERP